MTTEPQPQISTRAFISYSRVDAPFADLLAKGLEERGFTPLIDRNEIEHGEEWWKRIVEMITDAAAAVFVMSPDSVGSSVCSDELQLIQKLGLRLIPVMFRPLMGTAAPIALSERDWIRCEEIGLLYAPVTDACRNVIAALNGTEHAELQRLKALQASLEQSFRANLPQQTFNDMLEKVARALTLDEILWRREAQDWTKRAAAWEGAGRPQSLALRPGDIGALRAWSNRRPAHSSVPPSLQAYLSASEEYEEQERRRMRSSVALAYVPAVDRAILEERHDQAIRLAAAGIVLSDDYKTELEVERTRGIHRALWKQPCMSVRENPYVERTRGAPGRYDDHEIVNHCSDGGRLLLRKADGKLHLFSVFGETCAELDVPGGQCELAVFSPRSNNLFVLSNGRGLVFSGSGSLRCAFDLKKSTIGRAVFDLTGKFLVLCDERRTEILDCERGRSIASLGPVTQEFVSLSPNGQFLASAGYREPLNVWDTRSGTKMPTPPGNLDRSVRTLRFTSDNKRLVVPNNDSIDVWSCDDWSKRALSFTTRDRVTDTRVSEDNQHVQWTVVSTDDDHDMDEDDMEGNVYLASFENTNPVELRGHVRGVEAFEFVGAGSVALTYGNQPEIRLWDAHTGKLEKTLGGHSERISGHCLSDDRKRLVTFSDDGTMREWDLALGQGVGYFLSRRPGSAHTLPNLNRMLRNTGSSVRLIPDIDSEREITLGKGLKDTLLSQFSPDGSRIITSTYEETFATLWDGATGEEIEKLMHSSKQVRFAKFAARSTRLFTAVEFEGKVHLWDAATGRHLQTFNGGFQNIHVAGDRAYIEHKSAVELWDIAKPRKLRDYQDVTSTNIAPDASTWSVGLKSGEIVVCAADGRELNRFRYPSAREVVLAYAPDGRHLLAIASADTSQVDRTVKFIAVDAGAGVCSEVAELTVRATRFTPNGDGFLAVDPSGGMRLQYFNGAAAKTGSVDLKSPLRCMIFSPERDRIAIRLANKVILYSGALEPITTIPGDFPEIVFSPDGASLLICRTTQHGREAGIIALDLYHSGTGAYLESLMRDDVVYEYAFSPNGKQIVTACENRMAYVFATQDGSLLAELPHNYRVKDVRFNAAGTRLFTNAVMYEYVWDVARLAALKYSDIVLIAAGLSAGRGRILQQERESALFRNVDVSDDDLFAAIMATLSDAQKAEVAECERLLSERSREHCYRSESARKVWLF